MIVVCDLDDTLFPEIEFAESGFKAVGRWLFNVEGASGSNYDLRVHLADEFAITCLNLHYKGIRGSIFDHYLSNCGVSRDNFAIAGKDELSGASDADLVRKMVEVYRYHRPTIRLHADAERLFQRYSSISSGGRYSVAVITNGISAIQRRKAEVLGLDKWCDEIVCCDELGVQKPSVVPYQYLMDLYQRKRGDARLSGQDFIYIGDHALKDFVGARACGWRTARIVRENGLHGHVKASREGDDAERIITSLDEIR
jgi:putative hydrolase of the HAD superfamily